MPLFPPTRGLLAMTAARLASLNYTPYDGQPCIETDTGVEKFGDGVTPYPLLPTVTAGGGGAAINDTTASSSSVYSSTKTASVVTAAVQATVKAVAWDGTGGQPARPVTTSGVPVLWVCPTQPTGAGTVGGGTGAVDGLDVWIRTP